MSDCAEAEETELGFQQYSPICPQVFWTYDTSLVVVFSPKDFASISSKLLQTALLPNKKH
jgi:hypothetical protein